jgi:hypothetical protein
MIWLPVSTAEWTASLIMAEEPVSRAAANLVTAMARLPASAAKMTFFEVDTAMGPQRNCGNIVPTASVAVGGLRCYQAPG